MKHLCYLALLGAFLTSPVLGKGVRSFKSADGGKSFKGTLVDYNEKHGTVMVRRVGGKELRLKLSALHQNCQDYCKKRGPIVVLGHSISVVAKKYSGKAKKETKGAASTVRTPSGYDLTLRNRSKVDFKDLEVEYTVIYKKDPQPSHRMS